MHPFILFSRFTRVIDRWTPTAVEGRNSKIVCVVSVSLCVGGSWRSVRISSNPIANINNFFMGYFYDFSARSLSGNTLLLLLLLPLLVWFNKGLQFGYVRTDRHWAPLGARPTLECPHVGVRRRFFVDPRAEGRGTINFGSGSDSDFPGSVVSGEW